MPRCLLFPREGKQGTDGGSDEGELEPAVPWNLHPIPALSEGGMQGRNQTRHPNKPQGHWIPRKPSLSSGKSSKAKTVALEDGGVT